MTSFSPPLEKNSAPIIAEPPRIGTLYLLRLQHDHYFVGFTGTDMRTMTPFTAENYTRYVEVTALAWLAMHKFEALVEQIIETEYDNINMYVKICMKRYGIRNVRGGVYTDPVICAWEHKLLELELNRADFERYSRINCHRGKHRYDQCPFKGMTTVFPEYEHMDDIKVQESGCKCIVS